jgi:bacteriorhodopsin
MDMVTSGQFGLVYNAFSFAIAVMGAATVFFFLSRTHVDVKYRTAITITGIVTLIACYHYVRIFNSWESAYSLDHGVLKATGMPFNDAYRYVDWLLTVPLLLVELILVMGLPASETASKSIRLGLLAAVMVGLGYPGEVSSDVGTRWIWWALAMIPFLVIVVELFFGLNKSIKDQPESARGLVSAARYVTVISWSFYPIVFILPMLGVAGGSATTVVQVGYTIADIVAKAMFGLLVYTIAVRKSVNLSLAHADKVPMVKA